MALVPRPDPEPTHKLYDRCTRCNHSWHGLACRCLPCACSSSWTDPEA